MRATQSHWAVFSLRDCPNPVEQELLKQRLVEEYIAQGNPRPTYRIFIREVPRKRCDQ